MLIEIDHWLPLGMVTRLLVELPFDLFICLLI